LSAESWTTTSDSSWKQFREIFLTGENEPENALWRDDTARFVWLRVDQLSVAGSMLRRGSRPIFSQVCQIYRHFQAIGLRVLTRKLRFFGDAYYRSAKQIGTGNRENI
jgi:hypothetical protein